jgi:hypothetical protein
LPEPRRRLGREHDSHEVERAHLTSALQAGERELDGVLKARERLARELGDPTEIRAERDGLQRALTQLTREQTEVRNELTEREVQDPRAWVRKTLGEQPTEPRLRKEWEQTVRRAAHYRLRYDVRDPEKPLGAEPQAREQRRDWQRAYEALARSAQRFGRDTPGDQDLSIEICP